jgi:hypothetical protein
MLEEMRAECEAVRGGGDDRGQLLKLCAAAAPSCHAKKHEAQL